MNLQSTRLHKAGIDKLKAFCCFTVLSILASGLVSGADPGLPGGIKAKVNGQEMIYYSELTLAPKEKDSAESSTAQTSTSVKSVETPSFGSFNGYPVVLKGGSDASSSRSLSSTKSYIPSGLVIYNKTRDKFELTNGQIQLEVKPGNEYAAFDQDYDVRITYRSGLYIMVAPNNLSELFSIYSQLSNDSRVEYANLYFYPPPNLPL